MHNKEAFMGPIQEMLKKAAPKEVKMSSVELPNYKFDDGLNTYSVHLYQ